MPRALPPRAAASSSSTARPGAAVNCWTLSHAPSATTPASASASLGLRAPSPQWASHHLHPVQQQQQQHQQHQQHQQQPHRNTATATPAAAADAHRLQNQWQWHAAPTVLAPPVPADNDNPMSQHAAASPPSRPPSSASSTASSSLSLGSLGNPAPVARVHDHSRPLPPPRILPPPPAASSAGSTATSFRSASRTPLAPDSLVLGSARLLQPPPSPTAAGQATAGEVSLQAPRPDVERVANEYVETPFRPQPQPPQQQQQQSNNRPEDSLDGHLKASNHQRTCKSSEKRNGKHQQPAVHRHHQHQQHHQQQQQRRGGPGSRATDPPADQGQQRPITKQPVSFTKEPGPGNAMLGRAGAAEGPASSQGLSIMCERCGRCRCESCREPPPLPSRWLCNNACFCSAETALDYASCLCCVKGLFYHCADGQQQQPGPGSGGGGPGSGLDSEPGASCADEPCSCAGPRRLARWSCLSALALVLPCLLCYWPLRACVALCEACYAKHATQGCRCEPQQLAPGLQALAISASTAQAALESRDPEKRLLDPTGPDL